MILFHYFTISLTTKYTYNGIGINAKQIIEESVSWRRKANEQKSIDVNNLDILFWGARCSVDANYYT